MLDKMLVFEIAPLRKRLKMTQQEMAWRLNTTRIQICKAEKGQRPLSLASELLLSKLLENSPPLPESAKVNPDFKKEAEQARADFLIYLRNESMQIEYYKQKLIPKLAAMPAIHESDIRELGRMEAELDASTDTDLLINLRRAKIRLEQNIHKSTILEQLKIQFRIVRMDAEIAAIRLELQKEEDRIAE